MPTRRAWLANLSAEPRFTFHLKRTIGADLPARARIIADEAERWTVLEKIIATADSDRAWPAPRAPPWPTPRRNAPEFPPRGLFCCFRAIACSPACHHDPCLVSRGGSAHVPGFRLRSNVGFQTRDGVRLATDLFLPTGDEPRPTVLLRTPYDNTLAWQRAKAAQLADAGYAVALQDVRGRFDSLGEYEPFRNEGPDGVDAIAWLRSQPWCNGRIGMAGRSYSGWTQWTAAVEAPAGLDAIVPRVMATDLYRGLMWRGGAFNIGVLLTWSLMTSGRTMQTITEIDWVDAFRRLPLEDAASEAAQDLPFWRDWLAQPTNDDYWRGVDPEARLARIEAPAIVMGGWYDVYADDSPRQFALLRERGATPAARASQLVMGAWPHSLSGSSHAGGVDFSERSQFDLDLLERRWFDRWLRDVRNGVEDEPPARIFVMGANEWRDEHEWPLARTEWQPWYLHSGGSAATLLGDGTLSPQRPGDEPADRFLYHPDYPVPTSGGPNCCSPEIVPWGAYDQRAVEMRSDVLVYTSATLERDVEVIGPVKVVLYAASDGLDTDWTAKLVDVRPSGFAMNLCDGIIRARFRQGFDRERPIEPGAVLEYEIELMATANVFQKGHRIRLEISSSNFPRFDRNPNTGGPIGRERKVRPAHQTVVHAAAHPSHVLLPVISAVR